MADGKNKSKLELLIRCNAYGLTVLDFPSKSKKKILKKATTRRLLLFLCYISLDTILTTFQPHHRTKLSDITFKEIE